MALYGDADSSTLKRHKEFELKKSRHERLVNDQALDSGMLKKQVKGI